MNAAVGPENGPALVLFHGVTRCWRDFQPILPGLLPRWQVFAPDHRGHGASEWWAPAYRILDFVDDAVAFLDTEVPGPVVLLGHSLGAMVAAMVAARRPDRVRAVILEDPPGTELADRFRQSRFQLQFTGTEKLLATSPDLETLARELARMPVLRPGDGALVRFGEIRDPAAIRFGAECMVRMDPAVLAVLTAGRWLEGLDWFGALPAIRCPVLLLRADPACGGMLDGREADRIGALVRDCTRVELPGVGHGIHAAVPERMLEIVEGFLVSKGLFSPAPTP